MKTGSAVPDQPLPAFDGPRAARPEEMAAVLALVNATFASRAKFPFRMEEKFPHLFHPSNRNHVRVICHENQPISIANYLPTELVLPGTRLSVAFIGAVCTEPQWRGLGLSTRLLDDIEEMARQEGVHLLLISGTRGLYLRRQCAIVGGFLQHIIFPQELPIPFDLEANPRDCGDALYALYSREPVHFERTPAAFSTLLRAGLITDYYNTYTLFVTRRQGEISSYLVLRTIHDEPRHGEIVEYSGSREDIALALPLIAQRGCLANLSLITPRDDTLANLFAQPGQPEPQLGTVKILHPRRLLETLFSTFTTLEYSDASTAPGLVSRDQDGLMIHYENERFNVGNLAGLAQFLFGVPKQAQHRVLQGVALEKAMSLHKSSRCILPVPLPYAGNLNYI